MFPSARHLTLEDPRIRNLAMRLHYFAPGQPIPVVSIPGIASDILGFWSLWQISISFGFVPIHESSSQMRHRRIFPVFLADNGSVYMPTARAIWDQLVATDVCTTSLLEASISQEACQKLQSVAQDQGKPIYEALVHEHRARIDREREKADYAFAARRRTIERIGLPQVRDHRLNLLAQEERSFQEQLEKKAYAYPEMVSLIVIRVEDHLGQ
jgi:hypothetical protein